MDDPKEESVKTVLALMKQLHITVHDLQKQGGSSIKPRDFAAGEAEDGKGDDGKGKDGKGDEDDEGGDGKGKDGKGDEYEEGDDEGEEQRASTKKKKKRSKMEKKSRAKKDGDEGDGEGKGDGDDEGEEQRASTKKKKRSKMEKKSRAKKDDEGDDEGEEEQRSSSTEKTTKIGMGELTMDEVRDSAGRFTKGNDLFSPWYFGQQAVDELVNKISKALHAQEQERSFIGLVQATMMGKTRLILEASKHTPIILIRLTQSNVVYSRLVACVAREKQKITPKTSFKKWQSHNRRVMLFIRAFFLSYMLYTHNFKNAGKGKKGWLVRKQAWLVTEAHLLNASLLNGGQFYVDALFRCEVEKIQNCDDGDNDDNLEEARMGTVNRHDKLAQELHQPTLAIDECHMPLSEANGMLFHSDYEIWKQEDVLRWQRYELFHYRKPTSQPAEYPYANSDRTSLFSGFRWILRHYLLRPGGTHQTTIFTSTMFSVWEPLLDTSKYSRDKPPIARVFLKKMLSLKNLLDVIETLVGRKITGDERQKVGSQLRMWCGRPGFFFDRFLPHFRSPSSDRSASLRDRIEQAHNMAEPEVSAIFTGALDRLQSKISAKVDVKSMSLTADEIIHFLYYCYRLRGGNIECLSSTMADLVSTGFAIVKEYQSGASKKSAGAVAEPLVQSFLDQMAHKPGAYARCDVYIAADIRRASGTSYGNIAEVAIANQITNAYDQPLRELLNAWGLDSTRGDFLDDMVVHAQSAALVDDLPCSDPTRFIFTPDRITMPRDGIVMPDVSFYASNQDNEYCLVTIQCKVTQAKLNARDFDGAIRSISIHTLFTHQNKEENHQKKGFTLTPQAKLFRKNWNNFRKSVGSVCFVRVLVCTRGWTGSQRSAVSMHNKRNPTQPILLADATARAALFGEQSAKAIAERVADPQDEKRGEGEANPDWVIPPDW